MPPPPMLELSSRAAAVAINSYRLFPAAAAETQNIFIIFENSRYSGLVFVEVLVYFLWNKVSIIIFSIFHLKIFRK